MNEMEQKQRRMTLANRLSTIRQQKGMNQQQAANAMKCSQSIVSKYEAGLATVSLDIVLMFADAYGCSVDYLLGRIIDYDRSNLKGKLLAAFEQLPVDDQEVYVLIVETIVASKK